MISLMCGYCCMLVASSLHTCCMLTACSLHACCMRHSFSNEKNKQTSTTSPTHSGLISSAGYGIVIAYCYCISPWSWHAYSISSLHILLHGFLACLYCISLLYISIAHLYCTSLLRILIAYPHCISLFHILIASPLSTKHFVVLEFRLRDR